MTRPSISKTCSICGIKKPLSAFLQLGAKGHVYGAVCAACRSKQILDDSTTSKTGHNIDSKTKVVSEKDKREQVQNIEEDYYQERENEEDLNLDKTDELLDKKEKEKKHRQDFLQKKASTSFLNTFRQAPATTKTAPAAATMSSEQIANKQQAEHKANETITELQAEEAKQQEQKDTVNFSAPFEDTRVAGKIKLTQGDAIKRFLTTLGPNSVMGRALGQQSNKNVGTEKKDPLIEFAEKNWGPGSRKR